ncbi:MAG: hypothetical protein NT002_03815 [candidate division Zixibacteria bacterium]|nr:hypothetical protein [candidate division Zixibacteria bacterium]
MKKIMFALLLGTVIWMLFSPPILADGGNRIRNVISIHDPTLEEHPWQELDGASPSLSDIALSNIRIATQDRVTTPPRNIIGNMLYIYFSIRFDFSLIKIGRNPCACPDPLVGSFDTDINAGDLGRR